VPSISPLHEQIEAGARAVRHAANHDLVTRQKSFEHVQREIMRAEIERHADLAMSELLRRVDRGIRPHHDGGVCHDAAAAELAASYAGILHAAVIAPFAGVVHIGLALLEQPAVAAEGVEAPRVEHVSMRLVVNAFVRVDPLNF
jgi:hypothetical protein